MKTIEIFQLLLAIVIIVEATALTIGMAIIKKNKKWLTVRNIIILIVDLITGGILLWISINSLSNYSSVLTEIYIAIIASHIYRLAEDFLPREVKFCFNKPLVIINYIKLFAALIIATIIFVL
ncbi:MAG: hypothetical protein KKA84_04945 [Bacteroidetes bacterium]|nr:hypothetical protein [Bacteroidota bacterium]